MQREQGIITLLLPVYYRRFEQRIQGGRSNEIIHNGTSVSEINTDYLQTLKNAVNLKFIAKDSLTQGIIARII